MGWQEANLFCAKTDNETFWIAICAAVLFLIIAVAASVVGNAS
jgi:hypothetical protein